MATASDPFILLFLIDFVNMKFQLLTQAIYNLGNISFGAGVPGALLADPKKVPIDVEIVMLMSIIIGVTCYIIGFALEFYTQRRGDE